MASKHGLGRGLDALIKETPTPPVAPGTGPSATPPEGVRQVPVGDIRPNRFQPRQRFAPEDHQSMVESIKVHGVVQPLLARRTDAGIELVAGERRLRAAKEVGLATVPVMVRDFSDQDALELALIENLQRADLNPIEEAEGYQLLSAQFGLTQEKIAQRVGKARATVANALRLLELPEDIKRLVTEGRLSAGHARALLSIVIPAEQAQVAREAVEKGWSVREVEQAAARLSRAPRKPRASRADFPPSHLQHLSDKLHRHFGTGVRVVPSRTLANGKKIKGAIEIEYYSNEDLSRILELLGVGGLE